MMVRDPMTLDLDDVVIPPLGEDAPGKCEKIFISTPVGWRVVGRVKDPNFKPRFGDRLARDVLVFVLEGGDG